MLIIISPPSLPDLPIDTETTPSSSKTYRVLTHRYVNDATVNMGADDGVVREAGRDESLTIVPGKSLHVYHNMAHGEAEEADATDDDDEHGSHL